MPKPLENRRQTGEHPSPTTKGLSIIQMAPCKYLAEDIEVLTGLEPVKRRPGMYTDTARPNHLATEVIDNSVDEALAGHARHVDVIA
jgi:hypothetical protein